MAVMSEETGRSYCDAKKSPVFARVNTSSAMSKPRVYDKAPPSLAESVGGNDDPRITVNRLNKVPLVQEARIQVFKFRDCTRLHNAAIHQTGE